MGKKISPAVRISLLYLILGGAWIALSDRVLEILVHDPHRINIIQTYKGWFYVVITSLLLYYLVKSSNSKLQREEKKFTTLFSGFPIGLFRSNRNGELLDVNQSLVTLLGYPDKSSLLKVNFQTIIVGSNDCEQIGEALINPGESQTCSVNLIKFDKTKIWGELNVTLSEENNGQFILEGGVIDRTNRKIAEDKLVQLNEDLELIIEEKTVELTQTIKDIESFSYSVSHDLRAPLRAIIGFSSILMEEYADSFNSEVKDYLEIILERSQAMDTLIDDLLSLSRLNRQEIIPTTFSPDELFRNVSEKRFDVSNRKNINITVKPCPVIYADQHLVGLLFSNLISNAIKFSSSKQMTSIEFGSVEEDDRTVFYVKDNGMGFNMDYASKIFLPFERLHNTEEYEGSGIGLAIVKQVIQRHKGDIWVESEEGTGTTFYFTFNLEPQ